MKSPISVLALAIALTSCSHNSEHATGTQSETVDDERRTPTAIPLKAPPQPHLSISARPEELTLSWQQPVGDQLASIYEYNMATSTETLIAGDIDATTSSLTIASESATRPWHSQQFRLELCEADECVSSQRMDISTYAASTMHTVRPGVFLHNEQFADSLTVNEKANLFIATRPVEGTLQIYLHNQNRWVATSPVEIESASASLIRDVASSANGDTLAVLVSAHTDGSGPASIRIVERLGETWLAVEHIELPETLLVEADSSVSLTADARQVWILANNRLLSFKRSPEAWQADEAFSTGSTGLVTAFSINREGTVVHRIEQINQQLWLVSQRKIHDAATPVWQEFHRSVIPGIDASDDILIGSHSKGTSLAVAGWESTSLEQHTPVVWRFAVHDSGQVGDTATVSVQDSLRGVPTTDSRARIRFDISDNLQHLVLGWQNQAADDARVSTFTYDSSLQRWQLTLELPADASTIAKQGFAHDVALSADGQTLLLSRRSGDASDVNNRVGEVLIIR